MLWRGNINGARAAAIGVARGTVPDQRGRKSTAARPKETSLLAEFSRDLTKAATEGSLDPLVGREAEVDRVIQILCRRTKNNPVLIGEPGVGKTAIVDPGPFLNTLCFVP